MFFFYSQSQHRSVVVFVMIVQQDRTKICIVEMRREIFKCLLETLYSTGKNISMKNPGRTVDETMLIYISWYAILGTVRKAEKNLYGN